MEEDREKIKSALENGTIEQDFPMLDKMQENEEKCVKGIPFKEGYDPRREGNGRPKDTPEKKLEKKAIKEIIKEYKEALADMLPEIQPIIRKKALEGDMTAIKEVHDRVMDKAKQPTELSGSVEMLPITGMKIVKDAE